MFFELFLLSITLYMWVMILSTSYLLGSIGFSVYRRSKLFWRKLKRLNA